MGFMIDIFIKVDSTIVAIIVISTVAIVTETNTIEMTDLVTAQNETGINRQVTSLP
tara:strand:- start:5378 stop:5545 length:168 start_codon:yes stop_codon:yes gene_type:complete